MAADWRFRMKRTRILVASLGLTVLALGGCTPGISHHGDTLAYSPSAIDPSGPDYEMPRAPVTFLGASDGIGSVIMLDYLVKLEQEQGDFRYATGTLDAPE